MNMKKKGFSLIEILLVLSVIFVMMVSIFYLYPKIKTKNNANNEISNIKVIKSSIKSLYSSRSSYEGLGNDIAIKSKIFPENMVKDGKVINSFKGSVEVEPATSDDMYVGSPSDYGTDSLTKNGYFTINYYGVPHDECVAIVTAEQNDFIRVQVNITVVYDEGQLLSGQAAFITMVCNAEGNTLTFISR